MELNGQPPEIAGTMEQSYQRRILVRRDSDAIAVDLEDNFHRFGVRLGVRSNRVSEVSGTAGRVPWTTCPGALAALDDLRGHDVRGPFVIDGVSKAARHCTHLFDMATLALDHLRLDLPGRDYRLAVEGSRERERVALAIDGHAVRAWQIANERFVSPEAWRGGLVPQVHTRVNANDDPAAFLEIMLMRRVVRISHGRFIDQDRWHSAVELDAAPSCISFQPGIRDSARRVKGSARDFTGAEHRLLDDLSA
jgi:hypothetical protein